MAQWIFWTALTLVSWGIWAVLFRLIDGEVSPAHSQVISTLGILPVLVALWWMKDAPGSGNRRLGILMALGSGIVSCLGNIACYAALNHAKAATVVPLTALYPIVTVLLAVPLLKERLHRLQWLGIFVSLSAIYLFNARSAQNASALDEAVVSAWFVLPLAAIVLWGIAGLMQKVATNHISARTSAMWFLIAFLPVGGLILLRDPLPSGIGLDTWWIAAAIGFALALGNLTLLLAFSSGGKASIVVPLAGLYPLVSIPIALVAFHERLDWRESLGIALALAAVVLLSFQSEPDHISTSTIPSDASL